MKINSLFLAMLLLNLGCKVAQVKQENQLRYFLVVANGGGMASKGLQSDVPINRDERLMRVMNFAYH